MLKWDEMITAKLFIKCFTDKIYIINSLDLSRSRTTHRPQVKLQYLLLATIKTPWKPCYRFRFRNRFKNKTSYTNKTQYTLCRLCGCPSRCVHRLHNRGPRSNMPIGILIVFIRPQQILRFFKSNSKTVHVFFFVF